MQSGKSIEEISRALKGGSASGEDSTSGEDGTQNGAPPVRVPEDLVGIQAYLRWERNGKKDYPPEEQQVRNHCWGATQGSGCPPSLLPKLQLLGRALCGRLHEHSISG